MGAPPTEKAAQYIQQLDEARCKSQWQDVPELARKVEKHAPNRHCLVLTARVEAELATYHRTSTSGGKEALSKYIPSLLSAIEKEADFEQDSFQARVSLAWLHSVLEEPGLTVTSLPQDFHEYHSLLISRGVELRGWTKVCLIKGTYLKGLALERTASEAEAISTYRFVLSFLPSLQFSSESPQLRQWTESVLTRLCLLLDLSGPSDVLIDPAVILQAFRLWDKLFEGRPNQSFGSFGKVDDALTASRRQVWKAYYSTLSAIIQEDLVYTPPESNSDTGTSGELKGGTSHGTANPRMLQRAELRRVETIYESLLINETRFPKAHEQNSEIEYWVDAVMGNWSLMCGPSWNEEELGQGGKGAMSREVLDILYRAALKSFHSTQILRCLFIVHASVAEFDLACQAFDSYVEIVTRGKDRAEKSGEEEVGLDDDNTIIRTASEAIRVLCRFGWRKEAEKAKDIGNVIVRWLNQISSATDNKLPVLDTELQLGAIDPASCNLSPSTLSTAYRAIGISLAQWARLTYEATSRKALQSDAVKYLKMALHSDLGQQGNLESLYALALVLSELREIPAAIKVAKRALAHYPHQEAPLAPDGAITGDVSLSDETGFARERKLVSLWHLLSLLLTSRSDYALAAKSCDAAVEQFSGSSTLFHTGPPTNSQPSSVASNHEDNSTEEKSRASKPKALADRMEIFEKQGLLQLKITQLSLLEVLDGSGAALDASGELFALFARLFGDLKVEQASQLPPTTGRDSKFGSGIFRGSLFGRPKTAQTNSEPYAESMRRSPFQSRASTSATQHTTGPTIQVTDGGSPETRKTQSSGTRDSMERVPSRRGGTSKLQKRSTASLRRRTSQDLTFPKEYGDATSGKAEMQVLMDNHQDERPRSSRHHQKPRKSASIKKSAETPDQPLREIPHNADSSGDVPPPAGHSLQPPQQDVRLPVPLRPHHSSPEPRLTNVQERQHKLGLLFQVWLFMNRLYTRASMFEDAQGALDEAQKLVEALEHDAAATYSSTRTFADPGWGGCPSVEETWAELFCARGDLYIAQDSPHMALALYEKAVSYFPEHPSAIVGLSNILMDMFCQKVPLEPTLPQEFNSQINISAEEISITTISQVPNSATNGRSTQPSKQQSSIARSKATPSELNRLAARDRAFGLLSSLTRLGSGWDLSEAWYSLARAYEGSEQIEKAKNVLWWCVELEDSKPLRTWSVVGAGGFVL